ncbi:MAG TPA: hypothetical protein VNO18_18995 [Xanthobacteraceae bacterium]|nr:hypothetical protein [Xanthobacteraceae bacterium]
MRGFAPRKPQNSGESPQDPNDRTPRQAAVTLSPAPSRSVLTPRCCGLVPRIKLVVGFAPDRGQDPLDRNNFHRGPNGRHIIDAGTADDVAPRGGDELVAELGIGGALPSGGRLTFAVALLALAVAIDTLRDDARRDPTTGFIRPRTGARRSEVGREGSENLCENGDCQPTH